MAATTRSAAAESLSTVSLSPSANIAPADGAAAQGGMLSQKDMTFVVSPPELNFHAFEPHHRYEAILTLKNQTRTAKYIRIIPPESRFFSISEPRGGANSLKVAAGLAINYTVYFKPEEDVDYECDLIAVTEFEKFIIPVRAVGSRGRLSYPNVVHFEGAPIKATSKSTVLLSNVGTKPCEWRAKTSEPFCVVPQNGRIEPQQSMQVTVEFTPMQLMHFESSVVFDLGSGDMQSMKVSGDCVELSIALDLQQLVIPKTFISLERQGIVKVTNNGGTAVKYCWKAHQSLQEEISARAVTLETAASDTFQKQGSVGKLADSQSSVRLLKSKKMKLETRPMIFDDDVFTIDPVQGEIPARGSREFVVTFNPQIAMTYLSTAYLDIEGKADRMPLVLKSIGLGPQCMLSFDSLDLGDIFINSMHQYEVILENRGSIEAKFALLPQQSLFGPKFKFSPSAGIIAAGTTQTIEITFCSDLIGIVSETFKIHVQGSRDDLSLHFKGRVIGPTFHFDVEELDFGNVSYNFWHVKNFHLVNTSEIPMRFHLRVPEDQPTRKEFDVIPSTGTILPHGKQKIQLDFLSNTVQEYNAHLVVDIDEVGDNLDSLPIKATCIVPDLIVSRDAMDYGQCFIGYPYTLDVELRNETALSAKYEFILPSDDDPIRKKADIVIGSGDIKERKGIVHARTSSKIQVTLTAKMTGGVHVPLFVRVLGSDRVPHHIAVSARVTGPKVEVMPKTLEFGSVEVLTEVLKPIVIANNSPIPAVFTAKLLGKHAANVLPPFTLKVTEGVIKPNSTAPLHVLAFLDEAMKFSDDLVISVQNNTETEQVQLTASGKGYTIVPSIPMEVVDFGDLFTTVPVKRVFSLYNKGRRPQQIQWQNERGKVKEGEAPVVFSITPERATINGKSEEIFTIEGMSNTKGIFAENFVCKMSQSHKTIFKAKLLGNFQPPLLQYSSNSLQFGYSYNTESAQQHFMSTKPLTMKNVSPLDLTFSLKITKPATAATGNATSTAATNLAASLSNEVLPFTVDQTDFTLKKGESAAVTITFDAAYRGDRLSHKTSAKLTVSFANHGQKDTINLIGDLSYPNITLENSTVDFGCILNDTEQRKTLAITNNSQVPAAYTWVFEEESRGDSRKGAKPSTPASSEAAAVPINNVFDIIPFRGVIAPGATERAEVLFSGIPGKKFTASAVCQVEGGPDYTVQLAGEASSIHFKFDRVNLDFGSQEYDKWEEREIVLTNSGRVPFPFQADLSCLARPGMVEVIPMSGVVKDKAKIVVRFSPRVPDRVDDNFKIQVAHFDPQLINVRGMGLYSSIVISSATTGNYVTRNDPPTFKNYFTEAKQRIADASFRSYTSTQGKGDVAIDPALSEAERLYFRDIITEDALMIKAIAAGEAVENVERSQQIKRKTFAGDQVKYILSRYVIDMGNIVKGESRKKTFKITNTSVNPITFAVDRKTLMQSPVSLNPDKFNKLAAYGSQVVEVVMNTKEKNVNVGNVSYEVIVDIKGGPLVLLEVRAFVVVPQLDVSADSLDFGSVLVGMTRMMPIVIENTQVLPCEWQAIYPDLLELQKKKNEKHGRFVCKPEKGVLQPKQKAVIEVSFIPLVKETLKQRIQLKMSSNPKMVEFVCDGVGDELDIQINPPLIDLQPVFPCQPSRQAFSIVNNNSVPIELFCYDFDEKYLVEEEILRNAPEFFEDDVLLLPPREVGAALPDHLMEAYFAKLQTEDNNLGSFDVFPPSDDVAAPPADVEKAPTVQPSMPLTTLDSAPVAADAVAGQSDQSSKPMMVVVVGPPLSGKTTHAERIAELYNLAPLNIDMTVSLMMETDTVEGAMLRSICSHIHSKSTPRPELQQPILSSIIRQRLRHAECAQGVVVDDLASALTSNSDLILSTLREVAQLMGLQLVVVSLAMSESAVQLRKAIMTHQQAERELEEATTQPLSEIEYEKLDEPSRKAHDLKLKHFRDCKRTIVKTSEAVAAIRKHFEDSSQTKKFSTVQEDFEKEIQDAIAAEEEKKKDKKAPPPKKGAAAAAVEVAAPQVTIPWHEMDGFQRFKRLYPSLKALPEDIHRTVLCDREIDETVEKICEVLPQPSQKAKEAALAKAQAEALLAAQSEIVVPHPVTLMRLEKQFEKRIIKPVKYFKILTPVVKEIAASTNAKDAKKPAAKGAAAATQETFEELTRWVIQPNSSLDVVLHFCSEQANAYEQVLKLGVVGSPQEFNFTCRISSAYPEMNRDPKTMFNKKIRVAADGGKNASRSFVISKRAFEFGPLLIPPAAGTSGASKGKPDPKAKGATNLPETQYSGKPNTTNNSDKVRFTNSGMFPAEFTLMFENEKEKSFSVQPDTFTLPVGESVEVNLQAAPEALGEIKNVLVACVKDNPEPFFVDVNCVGARPEMSIDGKKETIVDFGRMMLRRSESKSVVLKNDCALPLKWKLVGADKLPPEVTVDTTSGSLDIGATIPVTVAFQSERSNLFNIPLKIEVTDFDQSSLYESLPFTIKAEAHDVIVEWTKELDFKTIRVGETKKEFIKLLNKGPYEVGFQFRLPRRLQDLVTITPAEGTLRGIQGFKDAAVVQVEVAFKSTDREVQITKKFGDIEASFFDPNIKELVYPIQNITVKGEALYNKFVIKPAHINFGPCLYKQKKQATFDIQNTGCFEIKYKLFSFKDGLTKVAEAPPDPAPGKKPDKKPPNKKDKVEEVAELSLGAFFISPSFGVIPVGGAVTYTVSINPEGNAPYHEILGIHIEDRDPTNNKEGIPFELEAESCVPGIVADIDAPEADSIFEEQQIVSRLDQFRKVSNIFAREDRVFSYGICLSGRRVAERFRLTNPFKIPCTISVQIVPRGDAPDAKAAAEAFDIQKIDGGKLVIPAHENRYVTVGFTPNNLGTFSAMLEANVEGGQDPKTKQLRFELRGEGSLPNLAIDIPPPPSRVQDATQVVDPKAAKAAKPPATKAEKGKEAEEKAQPNLLVLPRTVVGTKCSRSIAVRNVGDLPATIRFACPSSQNKNFTFPARGEDITLLPGAVERYSVFFEPTAPGECVGKITMALQDNHYEDTVISLVGEGYVDPFAFEGVDECTENKVTMGDCYVGEIKKKTFVVKSYSAVPLRYKWVCPPSNTIKVSPAVGHLNPGACKSFELSFCSPSAATDLAKCSLTCTSIAFSNPAEASDWDDMTTIAKWVPDEVKDDAGDDYAALRRPLRKVVESVPEPLHTVTTDVQCAKELFVQYTCDYTNYEIILNEESNASKSLDFRCTKIFQQRSVTVQIKNTGKVQLPFSFIVAKPEHLETASNAGSEAVEDDTAFFVSPVTGIVAPGVSQDITVSFKPLSVGEFHHTLVGALPFGPKSEFHLPLTGVSECPLVHFELPQSNYLSSRTEGDAAVVDPDSCVVQFFSRGIKIRNSMKFMVLNPTNLSYDFEWIDQSPKDSISPFRCATMRGTIHSGKKFEMVFEYTPETLKLREAVWQFKVIDHAVIPFLLVGQASEPEVYFSHNKLQFGQVIVGGKGKQTITIENRENVSYPFQFEKLPSSSVVSVNPLNGTIPPNSSTSIDVTFAPTAEEAYNNMLICRVKKVIAPLTVNVKGEGYTMHDSLRMQSPEGALVQLSSTQVNVVNLGLVQVNAKAARKITISNQGRFNLDYRWTIPTNPSVTLSPMIGTVVPNSDSVIELAYAPTKEEALTGMKLQCKITNGPTYTVNVVANASNPNVVLNWKSFDFGPHFLSSIPTGEPPSSAILSLTNRDKSLVAIDALFDNKDYLEIDATSFVINPGEKRDVRVQFLPKDAVVYNETLNFLLNGLTTVSATITGEGVVPKIEVLNRQVRFGILRVGEKREIEVKVQCKSKITTAISLEKTLDPELEKLGLSIVPEGVSYLKPKEIKSFMVTFRPPLRMRPFANDLKFSVCGQELPFINVSGSCQGSEVHVDNKTVNFGTIVVGTRVTKRVVLMNTGDLPLSFNWNERKLDKDFTMNPVSGNIGSHSEQPCELTYNPTEAGKDARRDIEVRFDEAPTLTIAVLGNCMDKPPLTDTIFFQCRVRESTTQKISVKNDSADPWVIRPAIDNNVWSGPEVLSIRPKESGEYMVTYAPQVCTKNRSNAQNDSGTIFFPLPSGNALLYRLEGASDPPNVAAPPIEREIVAKSQHTEKLVVTNWLKTPQKFAVNLQFSNDPNDESVVIKGVSTIDVPPNATREYKLSFLSYKEGRITGTVNFTNEETQEYQFYNLVFNVKGAKEAALLALSTQVRNRAVNEITLANPLGKPVTMNGKSDHPEVVFPASVTVPPRSTAKVPVEFLPLIVKEHPPAKLTYSCPELGDYFFSVMLNGLPPAPEKATRVNCSLGQSVSTSLRFLHFSKVPVDFTFKFQDPKQTAFIKSNGQMVIKVNPCTDVRVGQEVSVDVTFEPSRLGEFKETIEISSPQAGSYVFPIFGSCTQPQRQGPFEIRPNQSTQIQFKNVFSENIAFTFATDCPQFVVAKPSEVIPGKKPTAIQVTYKCDDPNSIVRGKLTVTGASASDPAPVQWVYYLRGMKESEAQAAGPPSSPPIKGKK